MGILCVSTHVSLTEANRKNHFNFSIQNNEGNKCLTLHEIENMYYDVILTCTDIVLNSHAARYLQDIYIWRIVMVTHMLENSEAYALEV